MAFLGQKRALKITPTLLLHLGVEFTACLRTHYQILHNIDKCTLLYAAVNTPYKNMRQRVLTCTPSERVQPNDPLSL